MTLKNKRWANWVPIVMAGMLLAVMVHGCDSQNQSTNAAATAPNKSAPNQYPQIKMVIPEYNAIERGTEGLILCDASDPDGDSLTYTWSANRGKITWEEETALYTAPSNYGDVTVTVTVSDGRGGIAEASAAFPVVCCSFIQKNPEWLSSSE